MAKAEKKPTEANKPENPKSAAGKGNAAKHATRSASRGAKPVKEQGNIGLGMPMSHEDMEQLKKDAERLDD